MKHPMDGSIIQGQNMAIGKDVRQKHYELSMMKSWIRIGGCLGAGVVSLTSAGAGLVMLCIAFFIAELIGIAEEQVDE